MSSSFTATTAYFASRIAFVATHVVFAVWDGRIALCAVHFALLPDAFLCVNFVLNDPFGLGLPTLDATGTVSATCTSFDQTALRDNVLNFLLLWWAPHSILARRVTKQALGTWGSALDRPIFALLAPFGWFATILRWQPIDTCARFNVLADVDVLRYALHAIVFALASVEVLGLFYLLPAHVFGTDRHLWKDGKAPKVKHDIIWTFPYGLVRHPAAAAFLWMYWGALPNWTRNHVALALLWTVFIVIGTLVFEEGGLRGSDEFGAKYQKYASRVNAFVPSLWSIKLLFGAAKVDAKSN